MVHVSQIYPCSVIDLPCELFYVCELGKYLKLKYNESLSLDGIILNKGLYKSPLWCYFRIAIHNGWVVNTGLPSELTDITLQNELRITTKEVRNNYFTTDEVLYDRDDQYKRKVDPIYDVTTPRKVQVAFSSDSDDRTWFWDINGSKSGDLNININNVTSILPHQNLTSIIAMVAINRLKMGIPKYLLFDFNTQSLVVRTALSYLILLCDSTTCLGSIPLDANNDYISVTDLDNCSSAEVAKGNLYCNWCFYHLADNITINEQLQQGYTAWYIKGQDMGLLDRWYDNTEKLKYCADNDIKVGDIVLMYHRKPLQKFNYIKEIESCRVCKILKLSDRRMEIEYINTVKTYAQGKYDFDKNTTIVKSMYHDKPYERLNTSRKEFDIADCGFGYLLYTEEYFILPLSEAEDVVDMFVDVDNPLEHIELPQNDLIFWILCEYGYDFDMERFVTKNYKNTTPLYLEYLERKGCLNAVT